MLILFLYRLTEEKEIVFYTNKGILCSSGQASGTTQCTVMDHTCSAVEIWGKDHLYDPDFSESTH